MGCNEPKTGGVIYRPFGIFRTVLALLVVVQHVGHVGPDVGWGNWAPGSIAVLIFFALSGFVIMEAAVQFYRARPMAFMVNRFLRITPQYLISLLLSIAAIAIAIHLDPGFLPNRLVPDTHAVLFNPSNLGCNAIAFLPGPCSGAAFFVPYVWALRVEVLFYAVICIGVAIGAYHRSAAIGVVALLAIAMFLFSLKGLGPSAFTYVPFFAFGVALYFAARKPTKVAVALALMAFVVCLWSTVTVVMPGFLEGKVVTTEERLFHIGLFSGLSGVLAILAVTSIPARLRSFDRSIGNLSYPIYLQQYCILVLTLALMPRSVWTVAAVFPMAILVAWASDWMAERPLRLVRDRVRGRKLSLATPAAVTASRSERRGRASVEPVHHG